MCVLREDYLLAAVSSKPIIHLWSMQKKEQIQQKMVCTGHVTCLASSPDGLYVVGAVQDRLHVWQVSSGNLLAVLHKHYQIIRCLKFSPDGSHFISGADDNMVLVWPLWKVLDVDKVIGTSGVEPRHTWFHHSLPVTDIHIGIGGIQARVFTSSLDQTCKIYELGSGRLLCNVVFDCSITSLAIDSSESKLYAGGFNGNIFIVNLQKSPAKTEIHVKESDDQHVANSVLEGHSKQVSCLCLSVDGLSLISGSHDQNVCIWDVFSGQCIKTLPHKGSITNLLVCGMPPGLQNPDYKPKLPFQPFKRYLHESSDSVDQYGRDTGTVPIRIQQDHPKTEKLDITNYLKDLERMEADQDEQESSSSTDILYTRLTTVEKEMQELKTVNKQIYNFAVEKILSGKT